MTHSQTEEQGGEQPHWSPGGAPIQMETWGNRLLSVSRIHTEIKRRPILYDLELPELVERKSWLNSGCEHQSSGQTEQFP